MHTMSNAYVLTDMFMHKKSVSLTTRHDDAKQPVNLCVCPLPVSVFR